MHLFKVACLFIAGSYAATIVNPVDDPFTTYVKSADYIASPTRGVLQSLATQMASDSLPFTPEDYDIIVPQLANPDILGPLLINGEVLVDMYGLSVPPEDARDGILALANQLKQAIAHRIGESIRYKTRLPSRVEVTRRIHATLDRLAQVDDLEQTLMTTTGRTLDAHPEYIDYTQILIKALPETFEDDVLDYMRLFFEEADGYNSEVADKLRNVIRRIQEGYSLFPDEYYILLSDAIKNNEVDE